MAKSWKSFVKKDNPTSQDPESSQELSGIEKELNFSLEELAKSNEQLRGILEQRDALEEKMRQLTNPSAKQEPQNAKFESPIDSITRKRREDQQRFADKRKLEEKLRLKKEELDSWAKKIKRIREKVTLTKERFDRKKEEFHRAKKKVDEFVKKVREKSPDDFDYEKLEGPLKKAVGDFPFTERMRDRTDEIFNKPVGRVIEKVTERVPVKKIVDTWEDIKDKKREAAKLKEKFERAMEKPEDLFEFEDFPSTLEESFGNEDPEKAFREKDTGKSPEKKTEQKKKKQSLFERLKERRQAKKSGEKKEKPKDTVSRNLDSMKKMADGDGEDDEEPSEKKPDLDKKEEERREEQRKKKREERRAERKEERRKKRSGEEIAEPVSIPESRTGDDSGESADQKKKEKEEEEKNELRRQEKIKDRIAERREARRQEERHERRKRVKDKFD